MAGSTKVVAVNTISAVASAVADQACAWDGDTLVLQILGAPNAKKDAIGKIKGHQLMVSVTAKPIAGRATDHMLRFLAPHFDVAINDIEVVFGRFNVNKQLRIKAPKQLPAVIMQHLSKKNRSCK
jgi:uncharacterized protein (TIGR00251 family)